MSEGSCPCGRIFTRIGMGPGFAPSGQGEPDRLSSDQNQRERESVSVPALRSPGESKIDDLTSRRSPPAVVLVQEAWPESILARGHLLQRAGLLQPELFTHPKEDDPAVDVLRGSRDEIWGSRLSTSHDAGGQLSAPLTELGLKVRLQGKTATRSLTVGMQPGNRTPLDRLAGEVLPKPVKLRKAVLVPDIKKPRNRRFVIRAGSDSTIVDRQLIEIEGTADSESFRPQPSLRT